MIELSQLRSLYPEIILTGAACLLFLGRPSRALTSWIAFIAILLTMPFVLEQWESAVIILNRTYEIGHLVTFLKLVMLTAGALAIAIVHSDPEVTDHYAEIVALALTTLVGGMLLISSRHLAVTYLAFEMLSVPSYALVGSIANRSKSTEGGLKYAVFGGAASGFLLYGFSILYGLTGSLYYVDIFYSGVSPSFATIIAVVFIFAGAMYKLAVAPFHYWCPDAFEAAPASIAGLLSIAPKAAGFGLLIALTEVFHATPIWTSLLGAAAVISMTFGNLAAIPQQNVKRLLAYSSIAHAGYMLVAAACASRGGKFAILFYLTTYLFMNLGAFYITGLVSPDGSIRHFRGLAKRSSFTACCMAIFLFSLTGLPPFGGFIGKLLIISAALEVKAHFLIIVLVANSVVSLYYYARILRTMYFDESEDLLPIRLGTLAETAISVAAAMILVLGLWWGPIGTLAQAAARY
ncbi:MAG: NADH-quinone oxidoreductase subunit N [Candidatus Hydrogenedentota bacterium]